jgi:hypothetical protein
VTNLSELSNSTQPSTTAGRVKLEAPITKADISLKDGKVKIDGQEINSQDQAALIAACRKNVSRETILKDSKEPILNNSKDPILGKPMRLKTGE